MAGGLLMALGGAMKGAGEATLDQLKEEAKAKREEALAQAQFERQRSLAADTRQFQADENEKSRGVQLQELDLKKRELDAKLDQSGDLVQTSNGVMVRRGDTLTSLKDESGQPVQSGVSKYGAETWRQLSEQEKSSRGLDPKKAYQVDNSGQVKAIDGGGTTVNVGSNTSKFGEKSDEEAAKRLGDIAKEGQTASQMMSDMQQLADLGKQVKTGKGAQVLLALGPYAESLGIDVKGLNEVQAYSKIIDRIAPNMRPAGSGATSDFDARQFLNSLPSVGSEPGANEIINGTFQAVAQNKMEAAEIARKAQRGDIKWQDAEEQIAALPNPYTRFKEWQKSNGGAGSAGPTQVRTVDEYNALPSGATYIDPNGRTKVKR